MSDNKEYENWKKGRKSYLKLNIGEKYECIYHGKEFDPTGGMKQNGAMKYFLEDLKDHTVREMSSSSQALDDVTSRFVEGDKILITVGRNTKGGKSYSVSLVEASKGNVELSGAAEDEDEEEGSEGGEGGGEVETPKQSKKVPF